MKAQCERCKEIVELRFAVAAGGAGIEVDCPACRVSYTVAATKSAPAPAAEGAEAAAAAAEAAEATPAPAAPEGAACPKCAAPRGAGEACPKCGLVYARWNPEAVASAAVLDEASRPEGEALWSATLARWDDPAAHDALLAFAQRTGQLAWVAARYRSARVTRGAAAEAMAARGLERLEKIAFAALAPRSSGGTAPPDASAARRQKYVLGVLAVLVLLLAVGLVGALLKSKKAAREDGTVRPKPLTGPRRPAAPAPAPTSPSP